MLTLSDTDAVLEQALAARTGADAELSSGLQTQLQMRVAYPTPWRTTAAAQNDVAYRHGVDGWLARVNERS